MSIEVVRDVPLWCAVINYGLLLRWFLFFTLARDGMHRFRGRWFRLPVERFDAIRYTGLMIYKIGIVLFTLVPSMALHSVG